MLVKTRLFVKANACQKKDAIASDSFVLNIHDVIKEISILSAHLKTLISTISYNFSCSQIKIGNYSLKYLNIC